MYSTVTFKPNKVNQYTLLQVIYPLSKATVLPNTPEFYAVVDYDADDEFNVFYHRYRVELLDAFRQVTVKV